MQLFPPWLVDKPTISDDDDYDDYDGRLLDCGAPLLRNFIFILRHTIFPLRVCRKKNKRADHLLLDILTPLCTISLRMPSSSIRFDNFASNVVNGRYRKAF
jgi:hypothetical protein